MRVGGAEVGAADGAEVGCAELTTGSELDVEPEPTPPPPPLQATSAVSARPAETLEKRIIKYRMPIKEADRLLGRRS